jgi:hypothetical protein
MLAALIIVFDQIDCDCKPFLWDFQSVPGQKRERDRQAYRETDGDERDGEVRERSEREERNHSQTENNNRTPMHSRA